MRETLASLALQTSFFSFLPPFVGSQVPIVFRRVGPSSHLLLLHLVVLWWIMFSFDRFKLEAREWIPGVTAVPQTRGFGVPPLTQMERHDFSGATRSPSPPIHLATVRGPPTG